MTYQLLVILDTAHEVILAQGGDGLECFGVEVLEELDEEAGDEEDGHHGEDRRDGRLGQGGGLGPKLCGRQVNNQVEAAS